MAKKRHWLPLSGLMVAVALGVLLAGPAAGQQANQQPHAYAAADPTAGQVGTFIFLDGTASTDADGTVVSYSWDFGDGTPTASGDLDEAGQLYHTYGADGTYTVTLTVTDNLGADSDPADPAAKATITIGSGTSPTTTSTTQPPSAGGSQIYASQCAACHGATGAGGIGPSLQTSTFTKSGTISAVTNGVGIMPGYSGSLTNEQIAAVSAYSVGLQTGESTSTTEATDDVTGTSVPSSDLPTGEGADLYAANCAACHGAVGEGDGALPINVPFANDLLMEIIRVGIGNMPGFATALTDEQIVVLSEYVHTLAQQSDPTTTIALPDNERIVAIQPSRYVEFDTDRSSVPLDARAQLAFALASMATLGVLAYLEVRRIRRAPDASTKGQGG